MSNPLKVALCLAGTLLVACEPKIPAPIEPALTSGASASGQVEREQAAVEEQLDQVRQRALSAKDAGSSDAR